MAGPDQQASATLLGSESRFQAIADSVDQMIWSARPDGYHEYYNRRWYEFTGVPEGSTDGRGWSHMFHPDDREHAWARWRHSLSTGEPYHVEYRLRHRSGEYRWVIGRAQPERDEAGRIVRWHGTCTDVHDLKQAEAALRDSEERFRFALEAAGGVGTWNWDIQGDRLVADAAFAALYCVDPVKAAKGLPIASYVTGIHPEDRYRVRAQIQRALACGGDFTAEYRVVALNGTERWVLARGQCFMDGEGRPVRFPGVAIDITDRKRTEEALAVSQRRLQAILDTVPVGIIIADAPSGRIVGGNKQAESIFGRPILPSSGISDYGSWACYHPDGREVAAAEYPLARVIAGAEKQSELEVLYQRDAVRKTWVRLIAAPILDEAGRVAGGVVACLDIDRNRRTEAALREAHERIELALNSGAIVGTWVWDIQADRLTADERFAHAFALDPKQCQKGLPLNAVTDSIHPGDKARVEALIAAALEQGGSFSAEYRVLQPNGLCRWIEASGRCDLDSNGRPLRFPGVLIDIEHRKQAEDRLWRSEVEARERMRLFKAVIDAVPALIYVKDREGRMQIANGPVLDLIGKPWGEVEGRSDLEFLDDSEQAARVMATDRRIMEAGLTEELEEVVGHDEHGPRIWLSHKAAFRNEQGIVVGLVGTSTDLTARKRAENDRQLLVRELNHRVKNLFSITTGMVNMTARSASSVRDMASALTGRLMALAQAHELIRPAVTGISFGDETTSLDELVKAILAPHLPPDTGRLCSGGPDVRIGPTAATSLALVLHELATNAAKYGALSTPAGCLDVAWASAEGQLTVTWKEVGGPAVDAPPAREGFGSRLARMGMGSQLNGTILYAWRTIGAEITLVASLERLGK
ncbi:PAS domain S-box protein [Indioceanicola profundi]|uniref:PAS domain S-box protein n=1 Tax=Indioceanicola profundi TaxID=2220096 RepID=UPI001CEC6F36|nr:PAS domain S-box protein [Indioceanicola profundi]